MQGRHGGFDQVERATLARVACGFANAASASRIEVGEMSLALFSATSFATRALGLLCAGTETPRMALLFPHCTSVHTLGMRVPIAVIGVGDPIRVDDGSTEVSVCNRGIMKPWRMHAFGNGTRHVIEAVGVSEHELPAVGAKLSIVAHETAAQVQ